MPSSLTGAAALFQSTGNMVYLAWCLEGLAGVAAAEHRLDGAAEIAGGRDALRAQTGVLLPPVYPAAWELMLETVRDGLGEAGFEAAYGRLAERPPPEIIAAAAGVSPAGPEGGGTDASRGGRPEAVKPENPTIPDVTVR